MPQQVQSQNQRQSQSPILHPSKWQEKYNDPGYENIGKDETINEKQEKDGIDGLSTTIEDDDKPHNEDILKIL